MHDVYHVHPRVRRTWHCLLLAVLAAAATPVPAGAGEDLAATREIFRQHEGAGEIVEAIEVAETFLREHPDDTPQSRQVVQWMGTIFGKHYREPAETRALAQRIIDGFADIPVYYVLGVERLSQSYANGPGRAPDDPAKAVALVDQAVAHLGTSWPQHFIYGDQCYVWKLLGLYYQKEHQQVLDYAPEVARLAPAMLSNRYYLRHIYHATTYAAPEQSTAAAKLYFVLCEFDEKWINEGIDQACKALSAVGGPGLALQFAKAQEDATNPNSLKDIRIWELGPTEPMLAAAGNEVEARINVYLYGGRVEEALELAKEQMQKSGGQPALIAKALQNIARCFKAHDVSIVRANQFLTFHGTGEGQNPLLELEDELQAAE